ncbi:MFS transporter [Sinosporangium siamense]|uniref:Putative proline/betaine transporter n=1 Tax=Sinosporangium siamense TaxID=1367973 RepID=A0A919REW5_9ACTN|nr:MFS transporter [Sinosporangium siamense]GII90596.1 MFS transporter [Sinosporangium siamense]
MTDAPSAVPPTNRLAADPGSTKRVVRAGTIGTVIEYYDFGLYGYTATVLARVFFTDEDPTTALLSSLIVFGVAFFVRPLGGVVFGHIGDRFGRKHALALTIIGMCAATFVIGILPGYASIGVAAPILLLLARLVQGLCAGGELGGAASYIAECSPEGRRGYLTSMSQMGSMVGLIGASLTVALVTWAVPAGSLDSWGWRIPFLISLPLGLVGLYIRSSLKDSPAFEAVTEEKKVESAPILTVLREHRAAVLKVIGINVLAAPGYYIAFVYSSIFLQREGGYATSTATWMTTASLVAATCVIPIAARVCDRLGRKPVLLAGSAGFAVLAYPAFMFMQSDAVALAVLGQLMLAVCEATMMGAMLATLVELFPATVRYSGLALGFNMAHAMFGGTAPYLSTWLISTTASSIAPAWIVIAYAVVAIGTVLRLKETAHEPLRLT